jgi:hypothetical protein
MPPAAPRIATCNHRARHGCRFASLSLQCVQCRIPCPMEFLTLRAGPAEEEAKLRLAWATMAARVVAMIADWCGVANERPRKSAGGLKGLHLQWAAC